MLQEQQPTAMQDTRPAMSLVARGKAGDVSAIATMLAPFLAENEHVIVAQYLGIQGMWGLGVSSFAAVTNYRVIAMRIYPFGRVLYQDGALEHLNSGVVLQPSRLGLYMIISLLAVATFGVSLLATPWIAHAYYRAIKSGVVMWIREGVSVYMFCDRNRFRQAAFVYRAASRERVTRTFALDRTSALHESLVEGSSAPPVTSTSPPQFISKDETLMHADTGTQAKGVRLLAILGGALLVLAIFIPITTVTSTGQRFALFDASGESDPAFNWVSVQPAVVGLLMAVVVMISLANRRTTSYLAGALSGTGLSAWVLFVGWVFYLVTNDDLSPWMGSAVGIVGATCMTLAGWFIHDPPTGR